MKHYFLTLLLLLAGLMRRWFEDEISDAIRQCKCEWDELRK